ncbi:hypothetical protein WJX72_000287 [[Myrmecia] bisecta]|uniref:Uncharacterized protein n=1 Tax=[Myrmecia] bisecta TaxID=41462 RepID=A0AAW1PXE5_9CHLO
MHCTAPNWHTLVTYSRSHLVHSFTCTRNSASAGLQTRFQKRAALHHLRKGASPRHQAQGFAVSPSTAAAAAMDAKHVVLGPSKDSAAPAESSVLVALLPGALLGPADYDLLGKALQASAGGRVRLYVGLVQVDWQEAIRKVGAGEDCLDWMEGLVADVKAQAVQQGFEAQDLNSGRCENMFVAVHSASNRWGGKIALRKGAGYLVLGAEMSRETDVYDYDLAQWTRPVLHVGGELDGQLRITRLAEAALQAAACIANFGVRHVVAYKPVTIVPGMNHGQFSNGEVRTQRGDIISDLPQEQVVQQCADIVVDFLAAHCAVEEAARRQAVDSLQGHVFDCAQAVTPYLQALGRGNLYEAYAQGAASSQPSTSNKGVVGTGGIIAGAVSGVMLPAGNPARALVAHPGDFRAAEEFCEAAQREMAGPLPAEVQENIRFAVTVHTDPITFTYTQPIVLQSEGCTLVHCHCLLSRPGLGNNAFLTAQAPEYFIKLKRREAILKALGLPESEGGSYEEPTGASINAAAIAHALQLLPQPAVDRYQARGVALQCLPDRDITKDIPSPVAWINGRPIEYKQTDDRKFEISTTAVITPVFATECFSKGGGQFSGNHYIKCISLALAMELILVDCLRSQQPS